MTEAQKNPNQAADPFYSASNMAHLLRVIAEIDSGKAKMAEHELMDDETEKSVE